MFRSELIGTVNGFEVELEVELELELELLLRELQLEEKVRIDRRVTGARMDWNEEGIELSRIDLLRLAMIVD